MILLVFRQAETRDGHLVVMTVELNAHEYLTDAPHECHMPLLCLHLILSHPRKQIRMPEKDCDTTVQKLLATHQHISRDGTDRTTPRFAFSALTIHEKSLQELERWLSG